MNDFSQSTFLRPEARPFSWASLNETQRSAFGDIVNALIDAVKAVDAQSSQRSPIDEMRSNRTILLSGGRGSGKTSLMLSLQRALTPSSNWNAEVENDESWQSIGKQLWNSKLSSRLIWLEALDMEVLPGPTNLLVAILARIERALNDPLAETVAPEGLLNPQAQCEEAQIELRRLMNEASLAWDGNVKERAASLDPDSFAHEVWRAENARLSLNPRLNGVLNQLATQVNWNGQVCSPLFVLPVDDFDLNPVRCLELLRLLRAITVPRLFSLVLGDVSIAKQTFQLKMNGDFARVGNIDLDADKIGSTPFFWEVRKISAHAIRKLLPPAQQIMLKTLTVHESLAYRPDSEEHTPTLRDALEGYAVRVRVRSKMHTMIELPICEDLTDSLAEPRVKNAADFLLIGPIEGSFGWRSPDERVSSDAAADGTSDAAEQADPDTSSIPTHPQPVCAASAFLAGPPREIADLWFTLARDAGGNIAELIPHVREWVDSAITHDANLQYRQQRGLQDSLADLPGGEIELRTDFVDVERVESPARRWVDESKPGWPRQRFEFFPQRSRQIRYSAEATQEGEASPIGCLDKRTEGYFTLLHDLIALSPSPKITKWIVPELETLPLATTRWEFSDISLHYTWPGAIFRSFWCFDRFCHAWNGALDSIETAKPWSNEVSTLAAHWMAAGASLLLGHKYPWKQPLMRFAPKKPRTKKTENEHDMLVQQVARLVDNPQYGRWRRKVSLWNFAVLLSPEYGIPLSFSKPFWENQILREYWTEKAHDIRTIRRRNAIDQPRQQSDAVADATLMLVAPHRFLASSVARLDDYIRRYKSVTDPVRANLADLLNTARKHLTPLSASSLKALEASRDEFNKVHDLPNDIASGFTEISRLLNQILEVGPFLLEMLDHPANTLADRALSPTQFDLLD